MLTSPYRLQPLQTRKIRQLHRPSSCQHGGHHGSYQFGTDSGHRAIGRQYADLQLYKRLGDNIALVLHNSVELFPRPSEDPNDPLVS
jgi:hypothetical protein